ncbi:hypothetical protein DICPUDRAFT_148649 [Dictyostelium purpureum]|uniref:Uncharacterized protein n=1 Tax=Dictyostelium purpureum TaxID=5786 RepID=F0ZBM8_DICPU|nr:uncharacterized protein DICPUDRAFT_148649 [Dictyostelium purpureum]EGC38623.1 hypothetical protein DICPUDRAFT_148649 [Dictyostelium purpureum]|eukprot:XP_003284816.1 hypothetical protein DICPUDRAFT_148649 [Dictyostelium purpureum]
MLFNSSVTNNHNPNKDIELQGPINDGISCLKFSPKTSNLIVAGSWDQKIRCWEVNTPSLSSQPRAMISHEAAILCTDWNGDGTQVFTGGVDNKVKLWNLQTNQMVQVAQHNAPVKDCFWIEESKVLVTGGWDKSIKYWDTRQSTPVLSLDLSERVYAMDCLYPLLVVATADRKIYVYNLQNPSVPYKTMESLLKYQTRSIACFGEKNGFALGSIEGRVAIQSFEEKPELSFTFKCHRENDTLAYAVNSISFALPYGTFATAGSDGGFSFWDKESKFRLKQFTKVPQPITCTAFNSDASLYAYASSYDWSKGSQGFDPNSQSYVFVHPVGDEAKKGNRTAKKR